MKGVTYRLTVSYNLVRRAVARAQIRPRSWELGILLETREIVFSYYIMAKDKLQRVEPKFQNFFVVKFTIIIEILEAVFN